MFRKTITPYIQKIEVLQFEELRKVEDLILVLPNFPQSTSNLRSLILAAHDDNTRGWDPSIDPLGSFPSSLRSLELDDIPLYPSFLDIRTLTELSLRYKKVKPHLDTLLELLEGNHSLERVKIKIYSKDFPTPFSQVRAAIANRIQRLSISPPECEDRPNPDLQHTPPERRASEGQSLLRRPGVEQHSVWYLHHAPFEPTVSNFLGISFRGSKDSTGWTKRELVISP